MGDLINQGVPRINVDLAKEREKCSFKTLELTNLIDGSPEETQRRRQLENFLLNDLELMGGTPIYYLSHKEKFQETTRKMHILRKKLEQLGGWEENYPLIPPLLKAGVFSDTVCLDVHFAMFIPAIISQGTDKQKEKWLKRAANCNILGTYAQTELGHGTFVRGIETTATYVPETQEFILNSPTLTSFKWWPGSLGGTCNYAIVLAQLYSLGKCHGLHMFMVQLRDEETHRPLPGIKVGDVGARLGMSGANNGYLGFNHVRIPRENMLMRNSAILKDGTYTKSLDDKLTYGTMVSVRVSIVRMASLYLRMCATIAIRYSAVRRQSQPKSGEPESQVIDYLTQQYKLFPLIASFFAFHYTAIWIKDVFTQVTQELESGNLNQLPELHALSSCFKAVASADTAVAVETCRLACGGHGYMACSGFPMMYGVVTPMCTYEGENTVLLLQTARSLMKAWSNVEEGKPVARTVEYFKIAKSDTADVPFRKSIDWIVWALERISSRKIEAVWKQLNLMTTNGTTPEDAWNLNTLDLSSAAELYARTFIVKTFRNILFNVNKTVTQPLKKVLLQILDLYGVHTVLKLQGDLLRFTDISGSTIEVLQEWLVQLLGDIRPNAIGIVDSFDVHDNILNSALGAYDGNVYERLFAEAAKSPLNNDTAVNKTFDLYLKPFMKSKY